MITERELLAAKRAADKAARKWNDVDPEEVLATLHLWLVENHKYVERYRTEQGGSAKLATALWRAAHKACAKEYRAVHHQADVTYYTLAELKRILPLLWERDTWTQTLAADLDGTAATVTTESDTALTILLDVDGAFEALPSEQRNLLAWRYHDALTYAAIGRRTDQTEDAARMAVKRALDRLHRSLGGDGRYN